MQAGMGITNGLIIGHFFFIFRFTFIFYEKTKKSSTRSYASRCCFVYSLNASDLLWSVFSNILSTFGKGCKDCFAPDKTDDTSDINSDKAAARVNHDIAFGRCSARDKALVVFIEACKAKAKQSRQKYQGKSPDTVDIQWKRNRAGEHKIFGKMCELSDIKMIFWNSRFDALIG